MLVTNITSVSHSVSVSCIPWHSFICCSFWSPLLLPLVWLFYPPTILNFFYYCTLICCAQYYCTLVGIGLSTLHFEYLLLLKWTILYIIQWISYPIEKLRQLTFDYPLFIVNIFYYCTIIHCAYDNCRGWHWIIHCLLWQSGAEGALRVNVMNKRQPSPTPSRIIRVSASSLDDMCANRIFFFNTLYTFLSWVNSKCARNTHTNTHISIVQD